MNEPWFENDDFWRMLGPNMFGPKSLAMAPEQVSDIVALLGLNGGETILDLPCGRGRHSIEFAKRGFRVTGVDRTATYLDQARAAAREANVSIEFWQDDLRHFSRPSAFDVALCVFTSLGYFDTRDAELAVLRNYHRNLKPGGAMVIELMGKEVVARLYRQRDWSDVNGTLVLQHAEPIEAWSKMRNTWTIIAPAERREFVFTHWLYSAAELRQLLTEAGFASCEFYGDLKKAPYDQTSTRLAVVARKGA
jgi:SAM-dependent methyltransferase